MKNVFSKIAKLNQANTQPPALRALVIQRLLELLGCNDSSGHQEVAQTGGPGSVECCGRCVEYLHTDTSTVSADRSASVTEPTEFFPIRKGGRSNGPSPPALPERPQDAFEAPVARKERPYTCTQPVSDTA